MQNLSSTLVVLATGGTIAGRAGSASDNLGYRSAELGVAELLHGIELDPPDPVRRQPLTPSKRTSATCAFSF